MIQIAYQANVPETTKMTLAFLEQRPVLKFMLTLMKSAIVLLVAGFSIKAFQGYATAEDLAMVLTGLLWLYGWRHLNRFILSRNIKRNKSGEKK